MVPVFVTVAIKPQSTNHNMENCHGDQKKMERFQRTRL